MLAVSERQGTLGWVHDIDPIFRSRRIERGDLGPPLTINRYAALSKPTATPTH
jgi:hypothetical protein